MINYKKENPTPELSSALWPEGTPVRRVLFVSFS